MANYCSYEMKIKGKKENVDKLIEYLKSDYRYENNVLVECEADKHFCRVFECHIAESGEEEYQGYEIVYGSCAWSVLSCMMSGDHTYYKDFKKCENNKVTCMTEATKELDLEVEIFSEEPGCCFMEHFLIDKGEILIEECVDWQECYDEEGDPIYDEYGNRVHEGGLEWDYTI